MQSLVALSMTKAEINALSCALREVIHLQNLLKELCSFNFPIPFLQSPKLYVALSKTTWLVLKWPKLNTRFAPG